MASSWEKSGISPWLMRWALVMICEPAAWRKMTLRRVTGRNIAGDHIPQHVAGPHRGELVHVAHQEQVGARLQGLEQVVGQQQVEHGGLVDHQQVDRQGILLRCT